jgi:hypothetical protein
MTPAFVVEPRLTTGAASSDQTDTVELGRLTENEDGPMVTQESEFVCETGRADRIGGGRPRAGT